MLELISQNIFSLAFQLGGVCLGSSSDIFGYTFVWPSESFYLKDTRFGWMYPGIWSLSESRGHLQEIRWLAAIKYIPVTMKLLVELIQFLLAVA